MVIATVLFILVNIAYVRVISNVLPLPCLLLTAFRGAQGSRHSIRSKRNSSEGRHGHIILPAPLR